MKRTHITEWTYENDKLNGCVLHRAAWGEHEFGIEKLSNLLNLKNNCIALESDECLFFRKTKTRCTLIVSDQTWLYNKYYMLSIPDELKSSSKKLIGAWSGNSVGIHGYLDIDRLNIDTLYKAFKNNKINLFIDSTSGNLHIKILD